MGASPVHPPHVRLHHCHDGKSGSSRERTGEAPMPRSTTLPQAPKCSVVKPAPPHVREGPALAEQDATKGTAWVATLRAYFDAFGDMAAAAAMVNVHPNTFRYRLRRITEVFGIDLDDPDERLVAELQLRFLDPR